MEPKFVDANGLRFGYLECTPAASDVRDAPLVLCVHGFPDTAWSWDAVLPALAAAGYRAVAPFTRGYHPTSIPADGAYDVDTLAQDLLALIPALGATRAILVGHDWGAAAAYAATALAPARVQLLITLAIPHLSGLRPSLRLAWMARHFLTLRLPGAAARLRANDFAQVDELVRRWSPTWRNLPASETARVKHAFAQPGVVEAAIAYYRAIGPRIPASLRTQITVPTVAFAGEDDVVSTRLYEKARLAFDASYEVLQVPGGHFMHREHPTELIFELVRVLRDHAR